MKSGNLNFLEPSGPLQACKWTAFPLPFISSYKPRLENIAALYPVIILAHKPGMEATRSHIPSLLIVGVHEEHSLPAKITGKRKSLAMTKVVH
jgi:hypothetical protein